MSQSSSILSSHATSVRRIRFLQTTLPLRFSLCVIAGLSLLWSVTVLRREQQISPARNVAEAILNQHSFEVEKLGALLTYLDQAQVANDCYSGYEYSSVIRLYVAATAHNKKIPSSTELLTNARNDLRVALSCTPQQSFLWYVLFWVEMSLRRSPGQFLRHLELSYVTSPHEAWVARFRSADALALFDQLSPPVQQKAAAEYRDLVRDNIYVAGYILAGADERTRAHIFSVIRDLPLKQRQELAKSVDAWNVVINIPGVDYDELYNRTPGVKYEDLFENKR
jgi:hypothetical protein